MTANNEDTSLLGYGIYYSFIIQAQVSFHYLFIFHFDKDSMILPWAKVLKHFLHNFQMVQISKSAYPW